MAQDCIFCRISRGEVKSREVYRDDRCFVIHDIAPKAPVHLLIIPTEHFTYLTNMAPQHESLVGHLFLVAQEMARKEKLDRPGYRLIINQGADAGQQVEHLHLHLLGGKPLRGMG